MQSVVVKGELYTMTIQQDTQCYNINPSYWELTSDFEVFFSDYRNAQHVANITPQMFGRVWYHALAIERAARPLNFENQDCVTLLGVGDTYRIYLLYTTKYANNQTAKNIEALLNLLGVFVGEGYYYLRFITRPQRPADKSVRVYASHSPRYHVDYGELHYCQISLGGATYTLHHNTTPNTTGVQDDNE